MIYIIYKIFIIYLVFILTVGCFTNTGKYTKFIMASKITKTAMNIKYNIEDFILPQSIDKRSNWREFIKYYEIEYISGNELDNYGFIDIEDIINGKQGNCQSFAVLSMAYFGYDNLKQLWFIGTKDENYHMIAEYNNGIIISSRVYYTNIDIIETFTKKGYIYYDVILKEDIK